MQRLHHGTLSKSEKPRNCSLPIYYIKLSQFSTVGDFDYLYFGYMQCFLHSDLTEDRPTTAQFKNKLPWFLKALPSASCAKGGHGAYTNSVDLQGWLGEYYCP